MTQYNVNSGETLTGITLTANEELFVFSGGTAIDTTVEGTLLLNGSPTTSFTEADINNGLVRYHETASGVSSDSFVFTVSGPFGNATPTQHFVFNI